MSSLSFSWSVQQNAEDPYMTSRVTEGARREGAQRSRARACSPLAKSEEKERLLAVFSFLFFTYLWNKVIVYTFLFSCSFESKQEPIIIMMGSWSKLILGLELLGNEH